MAESRRTRILIVEDDAAIREGLGKLLARRAGFKVIGAAANVPDALDLASREPPEIAVVDLYLPGFHGFSLIEQLVALHPHLQVIVFSAHDDEYFALSALRAGARGFVSKSEPAEHLIEALDTVLAGKLYLEFGLKNRLIALVANTPEIEVKGLL